MEVLKKTIITILVVCFSVLANAQQEAALQGAFRESYVQEGNKQYADAITSLKKVYDERSYEINLRLGWLYFLSKDYPQSQQYYQKAVALKPYSVEAKLGLVQPLAALQSVDKLLQAYTDILKIDPQNSVANYWTGVIYYNRRKYEQAARYFEKVANLYPFDYDGNHMLAWSYLNLGRNNDAKILFTKALLIRPGDASCLEGLGKIK